MNWHYSLVMYVIYANSYIVANSTCQNTVICISFAALKRTRGGAAW